MFQNNVDNNHIHKIKKIPQKCPDTALIQLKYVSLKLEVMNKVYRSNEWVLSVYIYS